MDNKELMFRRLNLRCDLFKFNFKSLEFMGIKISEKINNYFNILPFLLITLFFLNRARHTTLQYKY